MIDEGIILQTVAGNCGRLRKARQFTFDELAKRSGVSKGMLFSFEEIIAHVTKDETLMPGEFIGSGTVGNGCGLELGQYLEHGDLIELEVENIGILKNKVERQDA